MSVREEAARWFAILHRGVMTLEERFAYERWVADETHRLAMADMHRVWALVEAGRGPIRLVAARARGPVHSPSARRIMIGAMCAISVGLVALSCVQVPFWTALDWVTR
jgi:ferric-dicitrate binding protein FerR (iron transport regulator)